MTHRQWIEWWGTRKWKTDRNTKNNINITKFSRLCHKFFFYDKEHQVNVRHDFFVISFCKKNKMSGVKKVKEMQFFERFDGVFHWTKVYRMNRKGKNCTNGKGIKWFSLVKLRKEKKFQIFVLVFIVFLWDVVIFKRKT